MSSYSIDAVIAGDYDLVPQKATAGSAGYDLSISEDTVLTKPGVYAVNTGIKLDIPYELCGLILPRSSLHKMDLRLANQIGLIDSDYRGEIKLALDYYGTTGLALYKGTRLAQLLFMKTENTFIRIVQSLSETKRGSGGFGSTGGLTC